jgi:hypothetical protein
MFNASLVGTMMNMKVDIYTQQNTQDPNTGAIVREWQYESTIQCKVEPIKARGASTTTDNKNFSTIKDLSYNEKLQLKLYTTQVLSKRWRIQNIKTSNNRSVFLEVDKFDQPDTKFEVMSSHAVLDPFGKIAYYASTLLRTEVQDDNQA